ncbi:large conductance mechanosensitive channel protein MscL [Myxacorys almedinensis]|uniref:Large-conductance mechanosensitive channel n=1 Tax=Myxacorys almedinensis A TaxID=2690445 RepID=A0A8J7Z6Q6_9CYAN|nr:large conductance mechanosensitive channel protein MscL [Myxacorys almedinensis]NDJ18926.1 large conductance mechanosensitive channel protein MscL [Myxacorys almedinensis A]
MTNGGLWADFKKFLMQGNVVDLAVAVVIGAAFGRIVESLVTDVITPAIIGPAMQAAGVDRLENFIVGNGIRIGLFLAAVINFIVIAFVIFILIRALEKAKRRFSRREAMDEAAAPANPVVLSQERLTGAIERLTSTLETR